jgi:GT2 family glycosyltransferase
MPVINCLDYTRQAVASLSRSVTMPYTLIVIDNGSTDGTEQYFAERLTDGDSHLCYLRQARNLGVAASWNLGITKAFAFGHDAALVINNDIVLADDSVDHMLAWLQEGKEFVTGVQIGSDPTALPTFQRRHEFAPHPHYSCFLMTPPVWKRAGQFDERFWPAYFEDSAHHEAMIREGIYAGCGYDVLFSHAGSRAIYEGGVVNEPYFSMNRELFKRLWGYDPSAGRPSTMLAPKW